MPCMDKKDMMMREKDMMMSAKKMKSARMMALLKSKKKEKK